MIYCNLFSKTLTTNHKTQTYRDAMLTLKLLTAEQVSLVFSELDSLLPLHRNLIQKIKDIRDSDGRINEIGRVFLEWVCTIVSEYLCSCIVINLPK